MPVNTINHKKFDEVIKEVFKAFEENNLTLEEIAKTISVDKEFLLMLINNEAQIVTQLHRIIKFANLRMVVRRYPIRTHTVTNTEDSDEIIISRILYPKCSIRYDKNTGEFFNLKFRRKTDQKNLTDLQRKQVLADFVEYKKSRIDKNYNKRAEFKKNL